MTLFENEKGTVFLEAAVVLPTIILVLLAIMDFGLALYSQTTLDNAVRQGLRYAITHGTNSSSPVSANNDADLKAVILSHSFGLDKSKITIAPDWLYDNNANESPVSISATYPYTSLCLGMVGLRQITLSSSATMVITN